MPVCGSFSIAYIFFYQTFFCSEPIKLKLFHVYIRMIDELAACHLFPADDFKSTMLFNPIRGKLTQIFQIIAHTDIDRDSYIISKITM